MVETAVLICMCVHKNVRQKERETETQRERGENCSSTGVWCEAGSVFRSVLRYFGIILLDDTLAQTHGEDHSKELQEMELSV